MTPEIASPQRSGFPLMERPPITFLLAITAGLLNAWTFASAQTFATVQSGNVIQMGYQLMAGNWSKLGFVSAAVLAFGMGSFIAGAVITGAVRRGRKYTPLVQGILVVILGVALALILFSSVRAEWITLLISFAAGMQGNAFHKVRGMLYGNVAVTLVVQLAFNYLMQALLARDESGRANNWKNSGVYFLVLLGFAGGGALGFLIDRAWDGGSVAAAILLTVVLLVVALRTKEDPDPST